MFSDVGLYRHLVIQIVIFNNNAYVKTRLQAIETLYFDCAKCVLHTERLITRHIQDFNIVFQPRLYCLARKKRLYILKHN